jgi:ribose transport system permease protein
MTSKSTGTNAAAQFAEPLRERRPALRWAQSLLGPFVGLLLVAVVFSAAQWVVDKESPFLQPERMKLVAKQTTIVGMGALGMTVIIIGGGIDLSAGSILALTAVVLAVALKEGAPPVVALALMLATGTAAGLLNGLLITGLRLVPFIVTLGSMLAFRGLAEFVSDQKKIQAPAPDWLAGLLDRPPADSWQLVPLGVWIVIALGVVLAIVLRNTVFGRYVFAIGSSEATARLCGVPVTAVKLGIYTLGGFFLALAGLLDFNDLNRQGSPTSGLGLELEMIAAVVIGGGSLRGGRGSVLGSLVGATTVALLKSGCVYAGLSDPVQKVIVGAIIVAAVAVDQWTHGARE